MLANQPLEVIHQGFCSAHMIIEETIAVVQATEFRLHIKKIGGCYQQTLVYIWKNKLTHSLRTCGTNKPLSDFNPQTRPRLRPHSIVPFVGDQVIMQQRFLISKCKKRSILVDLTGLRWWLRHSMQPQNLATKNTCLKDHYFLWVECLATVYTFGATRSKLFVPMARGHLWMLCTLL